MNKLIVSLVLTVFLSACWTDFNSKDTNDTRLPSDNRVWGESLLLEDPVGYYELSWTEKYYDSRAEVVPVLTNLMNSSKDVLSKLKYAMSLHGLGALDDRALSLSYADYAKELISKGQVGVAFSLFNDGGAEFNYLTNDQIKFFLEEANKHKLQKMTSRLTQEASKRQLGVDHLDLRWLKQNRSINHWLDVVATVNTDLGYTVYRGIPFPYVSTGSGFFIDRNGYFITNYHVIAGMVEGDRKSLAKLSVSIDTKGVKASAVLVGYSKDTDFALLKVDYEPDFALDIATYADNVESGQRVYALGSPLGFQSNISAGLISNTQRSGLPVGMNGDVLPIGSVIQTDAAVNPGNSGGPLINEEGLVVGVVFAGSLHFSGFSFALPADLLRVMLSKMVLGDLAEIPYADIAAFDGNREVELLYVGARSQAGKAGLENFKTVDTVNNLSVKSTHDLQLHVARRYSNTIIKIGQMSEDIAVVLKSRPNLPGAYALLRDGDIFLFPAFFGVQLREAVIGKSFVITKIYTNMVMDEMGFTVDDTFVYMGRHKRGIPKEFYVAILRARIAKMGNMDRQMVLVSSLRGINWA